MPENINIKPLRDHVLIEPQSPEEITASGIVIPDTASKERPEQGRVVAVGPGKVGKNGSTIAMDVKEGDVVLFAKYGPNEIKIKGKEYLIAKQDDILAILAE